MLRKVGHEHSARRSKRLVSHTDIYQYFIGGRNNAKIGPKTIVESCFNIACSCSSNKHAQDTYNEACRNVVDGFIMRQLKK